MYYINSPGRIPIDLFKVVQKDYKFESYKLDNVAGEYICGKITGSGNEKLSPGIHSISKELILNGALTVSSGTNFSTLLQWTIIDSLQ